MHSNTFAYTHVHPTPTIPDSIDLYSTTDVFTINLITQLHRKLFKSHNNSVVPDVVERFDVSSDGMNYKFILKKLKFHNGKVLTSYDVKHSLESLIKNHAVGHEKLKYIFGYKDYIDLITKDLVGIQILSENSFIIRLVRPVPNLLSYLTDFRLSITNRLANHSVGLGDYKLNKISQDEIELLLVADSKKNIPSKIYYQKSDFNNAIALFQNGEYHDLFSYPVDSKVVNSLPSNINSQKIYTPRTYLFVINSRRIDELEQRQAISNIISKNKLINSCYEGNDETVSLIPPGFFGYISKLNSKNGSNVEYVKDRLKISVSKGVNNEKCVSEYIVSVFSRLGIQADVIIEDITSIMKKWENNSLDMYFAYFETDNTLDIFQVFHPESNFKIINTVNKGLVSMIESYNLITDPIEKQRKASMISNKILDLHVVLPLFHPEQYLVYDNKYSLLNLNYTSPTFIKFNKLEKREY